MKGSLYDIDHSTPCKRSLLDLTPRLGLLESFCVWFSLQSSCGNVIQQPTTVKLGTVFRSFGDSNRSQVPRNSICLKSFMLHSCLIHSWSSRSNSMNRCKSRTKPPLQIIHQQARNEHPKTNNLTSQQLHLTDQILLLLYLPSCLRRLHQTSEMLSCELLGLSLFRKIVPVESIA